MALYTTIRHLVLGLALVLAFTGGWAAEIPAKTLVNNIFAETDLRQAISDIAAQTGVTLIADATVQGTVTAELKDVPLDDALAMILLSGGYTYEKIGKYYLIGAADPTNPNYHLLCRTEVVELKYGDPRVIVDMLSSSYERYLSAEGVPPRTESELREQQRNTYLPQPVTPATTQANTPQTRRIVITAPSTMIERIKADITSLDRPRTQIMLEASVIELSEATLKQLGVDWATRWLRGDLTSGGPNLIYSTVANTELAQLTALSQTGKATLRANPRIATADGQTAELEVGKENYFAIVAGPVTYPYTTLEKITSGILFRITPRVVMPEGEIIARIDPEVRDVTGKGTNGLPEITFRRASTTLRVHDGQSIVIGGLVTESTSQETKKFPFLGDLPLVGRAFRRDETSRLRSEVVIIITPHIMAEDGTTPGYATPLTGSSKPQNRRGRLQQEYRQGETE